MKYIFPKEITRKERNYIRNRFRQINPEVNCSILSVHIFADTYTLTDVDNLKIYKLPSKRIATEPNETGIGFACTDEFKDNLYKHCYKNDISVSNFCRTSIIEQIKNNQ